MTGNLNGHLYYPIMLPGIEVFRQSSFVNLSFGISPYPGCSFSFFFLIIFFSTLTLHHYALFILKSLSVIFITYPLCFSFLSFHKNLLVSHFSHFFSFLVIWLLIFLFSLITALLVLYIP